MNQYTTIIPKHHIYFEEIIEQRLAKYGIRTRFNEDPEVSTIELFLANDPRNSIEVVECKNSVALFRTTSKESHETIQKIVGALENEFYTFMIYIENLKIPNQIQDQSTYAELAFSENETCFLDDFLYQDVIEAIDNPDLFHVSERRDIFEDDYPLKIELGVDLIMEDPSLLIPRNKNKLLIKINAMYRDVAVKFNGPRKSLDIVDWALALA
jgi:hypothetical protein